MLQEVITENIGEMGYLPDFGPSPNKLGLPMGLINGRSYKSIPRCLFEKLTVSANIDLPSICGINATLTTERTPQIITPIQAYEIAISTLRIYEDKWNAYVKEEAKLQSIFDEDED
jgi:hypothetical protein